MFFVRYAACVYCYKSDKRAPMSVSLLIIVKFQLTIKATLQLEIQYILSFCLTKLLNKSCIQT